MTARQIGQRPRRTHCFLAHSKHMHRCPHVYRAQSTGLSKHIEHSPSLPDGGCCETKRNSLNVNSNSKNYTFKKHLSGIEPIANRLPQLHSLPRLPTKYCAKYNQRWIKGSFDRDGRPGVLSSTKAAGVHKKKIVLDKLISNIFINQLLFLSIANFYVAPNEPLIVFFQHSHTQDVDEKKRHDGKP